jgi:hypothetical protein
MAMAAAITNTYRTTGANSAVGQREDLSDTIDRIDPTDVPFYSNADKRSAKAILTEWQVQELIAPAKNAQPEGFDATFAAPKPTVRLGNYVQLAANSYIVSDTLDAVTTAGRERETTYQALLKGLEIKRDVEYSMVSNQIKKGTDPREMASFPTWITNGSVGATGTMPAGDGSTAPVAGTTRALTLAIISDAMQQAYLDGGKPEILMLPTTLKVAFSKLAYPTAGTGSVVSNEYTMTSVKEAVIIGSVSVYLTDFGRLDVVVNRIMDVANPNCFFLIDPSYYDVATLPGRSFRKTPLAKTGSADKGMMEWEGTLRVTAPKAHAAGFAIIP